jgi:hypothetical protein
MYSLLAIFDRIGRRPGGKMLMAGSALIFISVFSVLSWVTLTFQDMPVTPRMRTNLSIGQKLLAVATVGCCAGAVSVLVGSVQFVRARIRQKRVNHPAPNADPKPDPN